MLQVVHPGHKVYENKHENYEQPSTVRLKAVGRGEIGMESTDSFGVCCRLFALAIRCIKINTKATNSLTRSRSRRQGVKKLA